MKQMQYGSSRIPELTKLAIGKSARPTPEMSIATRPRCRTRYARSPVLSAVTNALTTLPTMNASWLPQILLMKPNGLSIRMIPGGSRKVKSLYGTTPETKWIGAARYTPES